MRRSFHEFHPAIHALILRRRSDAILKVLLSVFLSECPHMKLETADEFERLSALKTTEIAVLVLVFAMLMERCVSEPHVAITAFDVTLSLFRGI